MRFLLVLGAALLIVTGCTPSGCRRQVEEGLTPADSLSRQVAQKMDVDSLTLAWSSEGLAAGSPEASGTQPLSLPRTVRFLPDGGLVVSDAQTNVLHRFDPDGRHAETWAVDGLDVPYLAGLRGDTLIVFNAGSNRIDAIVDGRRLAGWSRTLRRPSEETLAYAAASDTSLYAKIVGEDVASTVGRIGPKGVMTETVELPGPFWRHAGFLRVWGDSLASLSGYRPTVTLLSQADLLASPDSLRLVGFDSPMLERSYRFLAGDVTKAPLLSVSAAPLGDALYVLNLRFAGLRVDVYGRDGRLQHVLAGPQRETAEGKDGGSVYPRDLAVRRAGSTVEIAVVVSEPSPRVLLYRWMPEAPRTASRAGE